MQIISFPFFFVHSSPHLSFHTTHSLSAREKESGVPRSPTSCRRHRQTPLPNMNDETRHVISHAARSPYSAWLSKLWRFFYKASYADSRTSARVSLRTPRNPLAPDVRPWRGRPTCPPDRSIVSVYLYSSLSLSTNYPSSVAYYTKHSPLCGDHIQIWLAKGSRESKTPADAGESRTRHYGLYSRTRTKGR